MASIDQRFGAQTPEPKFDTGIRVSKEARRYLKRVSLSKNKTMYELANEAIFALRE